MSWWKALLGRGFSPQTTSATERIEIDPDLSRWLAAAYDAASWRVAAGSRSIVFATSSNSTPKTWLVGSPLLVKLKRPKC